MLFGETPPLKDDSKGDPQLMEERIITSEQLIIDADVKQECIILLLKGKGENTVQLNSDSILKVASGHQMIRFTKEHFCLLNGSILAFYTLAGEYVSEYEVGAHIHELFSFKDGVLCIYGDQGVYGQGRGRNLLNYVSPYDPPASFYDIAVRYELDYDSLFARHKPCACLNQSTNEMILFNEQLKVDRTMYIPFQTGNVIAFALTHQFAIFIEEDKLYKWDYQKMNRAEVFPGAFSYRTRSIYHRNEFQFIERSEYAVRMFKFK